MLCERRLSSLPRYSWPRRSSFTPVRRRWLSRLTIRVRAHVSQGTLATLLASKTLLRYYFAVLLIAGLAPFSEIVYRFFSEGEGGPLQYWNTYYFLYAIGPHLSSLLCLCGCFLLFNRNNSLRYVVAIPMAYKVAKIIWLASVDSNEAFHAFVPLMFLLAGLAFVIVWLKVFDFLMSLHFHKRDGIIARIIGIINSPGIDDATARHIAQNEIKNYKSII